MTEPDLMPSILQSISSPTTDFVLSLAVPNTGVDQADLINAELSDIGAGGTLVLPSGTYAIGSSIRLLPGQTVVGRGAAIIPLSKMNSMFEATGSSTVTGFVLQNVGGRATTAIHTASSSTSTPSSIISNVLVGFDVAVQIGSGSYDVGNNFFLANRVAIVSAPPAWGGRISANYVLGGSGLDLANANNLTDTTEVFSNIILPAVQDAFGIRIGTGSSVHINRNVIDQVRSGAGIIVDGTEGMISRLSISKNYVGTNLYAASTTNGIQISGDVVDTTVAFNTIVGWRDYDIDISDGRNVYVLGNNLSSVDGVGNLKLSSVRNAILVGNEFESSHNSLVESGITNSAALGNTFSVMPNYALTSIHSASRGDSPSLIAPIGEEFRAALAEARRISEVSRIDDPPAAVRLFLTASTFAADGLVPSLVLMAFSDQADNSETINAALNRLAPGGTLVMPAGTFGLRSPIQLNGRNLAGTDTTLIPLSSMAAMININGGFSTISGLRLLNYDSLAETGIDITKPSDNLPTVIETNTVQGFVCAIKLRGDNFSVRGNTFVENLTGVYVGSFTLNGRIVANHIVGGNGIDLEGGDQQPEGVDIASNVIRSRTPGSFAVRIGSGLYIQVSANIIDQASSGPGVVLDASKAPVAYVSVIGNVISGDATDLSPYDGLTVSGNATNTTVSNNTIVNWSGYGIRATGANKLYVSGNLFDSSSSFGNIKLEDVANATLVGNTLGSGEHEIIETGSTASIDIQNIASRLAVVENSLPIDIGVSAPSGLRVITVSNLPSNGMITLAGGSPVFRGDVLTNDDLGGLRFTPTHGVFDRSSSLAYTVADASGVSYTATVELLIGGAVGNPTVSSPNIGVVGNSKVDLGIEAPCDPNYDAATLTITVASLPSNGSIARAGNSEISVGDRLSSRELTTLTFTPNQGASDQSSNFSYRVSDPAGNTCDGAASISVGPTIDIDPVTGVTLPSIEPNLNASFKVTNLDGHRSGGNNGTAYNGPVSFLQSQFIWTGTQGIAARAEIPNAFLHGGSGDDALQVTSGENVLDGGSGSNFLVGADGADHGSDVFFLDARGIATTWSTILNFHIGDEATIWSLEKEDVVGSWSSWTGAPGYEGATLDIQRTGAETNSSTSLTFAGITEGVAARFVTDRGLIDGIQYLHFSYTQ